MKLYQTRRGILLNYDSAYFIIHEDWDVLLNQDGLFTYLTDLSKSHSPLASADAEQILANEILAPIGTQEVWAAGVTYLRSMEARVEESTASGFATLYDKVYLAERPELFFKSLPHRVAAHGETVHIRKDSSWNVPEPELTLVINKQGKIVGYTIGNDMSSRSIEGENALYLPQAKTYDRSAALGPCVLVLANEISPETQISMSIYRNGQEIYQDQVLLNRMKRSHTELVAFLYRELSFEHGAYLMTGTCLVPGHDFTLALGDVVEISIEGIGMLKNTVSERE